jgi:hypothetical protein
MTIKSSIIPLLFETCLVCSVFASSVVAPQKSTTVPREYDVVIYGGTGGGVIAAVSAAREGAKVLVLEPTGHLGGMVAGGLGRTDTGIFECVGGLADEFYRRMNKHYDQPEAWKWETREAYLQRAVGKMAPIHGRWYVHEPSAATAVFQAMLDETDVTVLRHHRILSVTKSGQRLRSVRCANGAEFTARLFMDTTYEGDLMALAGVSYRWDRESRAEYDESVAGVLLAGNPQFRQPKELFGLDVDPYIKPGDPSSGLLPGIQKESRGEPGSGDSKGQAYNFRICLTDNPDNRIPITRPDRYDPFRYELLARWIATQTELQESRSTIRSLLRLDCIPNRKTDINDGGPFSTDYIGANWDYSEGDLATRQRIIQDHIDFTKGLIYFIASDPRVPESIRKEMQHFGYPKDEYVENGNWSPQLYIREARRMTGRYVMTQHDIQSHRSKDDSVGLGSYGLDSHHVQRIVHEGQVINEGNFWVGPMRPYEIPYRAITPRKAECENLLVTFCVSASHVAFGSIRMEPVFMILSESAAVAALMALRENVAVQDIDIAALQRRLSDRKQIFQVQQLEVPRLHTKTARDPSGKSAPGIMLNVSRAHVTGDWKPSNHCVSAGEFYRHDLNERKGGKAVRYELTVPRAGRYEVRLSYSAHRNRATNVPVNIEHTGGTATHHVNQRIRPAIDGLWASLGVYAFTPEHPAVLTLSNAETDGYVIADTVRLLPVEPESASNAAGK